MSSQYKAYASSYSRRELLIETVDAVSLLSLVWMFLFETPPPCVRILVQRVALIRGGGGGGGMDKTTLARVQQASNFKSSTHFFAVAKTNCLGRCDPPRSPHR